MGYDDESTNDGFDSNLEPLTGEAKDFVLLEEDTLLYEAFENAEDKTVLLTDFEDDRPTSRRRARIAPPGFHTVSQGESLPTIANLYGFSNWNDIWTHPKNSDLSTKRKPNILYPGDRLFVPVQETRKEACQTDRRHRFKAKGRTCWLRLILKDSPQKARADVPYVLNVHAPSGSFESRDKTDAEGLIQVKIPIDATHGDLRIENPDVPKSVEIFRLYISHLDPVEKKEGVPARLNNLGYRLGTVDGKDDILTNAAFSVYKFDKGLTCNSEMDEETLQVLLRDHGC